VDRRAFIERELRRWIRNHHAVIGYTEALDLGASPATVRVKADRGEWERVYRGVYRDSASPRGPYQDLRAACVATAGFGVVSHASAAWVWGLLPQPPATPELTVRRESRTIHEQARLTIHRSRGLDLARTVSQNSIFVTNPLRTLVDLAGTARPSDLTLAVDRALASRLVTTAGLVAEIDRLARSGRDGVAILRRHLLGRAYIGAPEPSVLEAHTRRLVVGTVLPLPQLELRVGEDGEYRLDLAWAAILLAVEVDGYAFHFSPEQVQRDVSRRNKLQQAGWTVLVFTWHQVLHQPQPVAQQIIDVYRALCQRVGQ
jgi:hypothetical protein